MTRRARSFLQSVGGRLFLPLAITLIAVLGVHALLTFGSARDHFHRFVRADVDRHSDLFMRATHDGMLLNRLDEVQAIIERLASGPQVAAIRFYDKEGAIILSAARDEIGQRIGIDSETCRSCHGAETVKDAAMLERSALTRLPEGLQVLRQLTVVENEPECATASCHYHPPSERVLGVLDVEMSMAPFDEAIRTARKQLVKTTLLLILITGLVAAVVIRGVVLKPVLRLQEGTRRIARGELDTRIEVRGGHELAMLADAFNHMVDDLRDARREVDEWSQKLEDKVAARTEELRQAERQVLHMERMASLGKLSASVAHELNNPLGGMLTYARLLKRELKGAPLDPEMLEEIERYVSIIDTECSRCGEIVKNLLTFARRTGSSMSRVDLNEIVERSLLLIRHHLQISSVQLRSELLPDGGEIVADAGQLEQALLALLVNAVEAMEPVQDRARVLTVRLRDGEDQVRIEIADTGVGIPPEVLPHIFEPFYSTKTAESGVGLGLAVVYGIIQRHGGAIDVETEPGLGTTFRIRLPRQPVRREDDDAHDWLVTLEPAAPEAG